MSPRYNPYEKYGLRLVVNAAGTFTSVGGSIASPEVFKAMEDASKSFMHITWLQEWAGKEIAKVTGAEAGFPTCGASSALILAAAACIFKGTELENYEPAYPETWSHISQKIPAHTEELKNEFIIQKANRNMYDHAVEVAGGHIIEVGTKEAGATREELDAAYNPEKTAAYYITEGNSPKCLSIAAVADIAHKNRVPLIVDVAGRLPPKKNLKRYLKKGADLVAFSGGKSMAGPNNSGILAGRKDLIKLAHLQAFPFHGIGRSAKMSRETIVGLVTALKLYLEQDEDSLYTIMEKKARYLVEQLNKIPDVKTEIHYQTTVEENEHTTPLIYVRPGEGYGLSVRDLYIELETGTPSIKTSTFGGVLSLNPKYLLEGDEEIIITRIKEVLEKRR